MHGGFYYLIMNNYIKTYYPVIFHPEDVGFSTTVPDIDGCFSQGDTMCEAVEMTQDAIGLMLEDYFESKTPLPTPSTPNSHSLENGDFIALVEFDELAYRKKHEKQSVKKTLTIPSWLNYMAEEQGINFSRVLQNALKRELGVQ